MQKKSGGRRGALLGGLLFLVGAAAVANTPYPPPYELPAHPDLPSPFRRFPKGAVNTDAEWNRLQRPELRELFRHYMYGYEPRAPKLESSLVREDRQALAGKATLREVTLKFGPPGTRPIHLLEVLPNRHKGRAPLFLGLNFCGNHAVLADPKIQLADGWLYPGPGVTNNQATNAARGTAVDTWNIEGSIDRGYAVATFYNGDVEPDHPDAADGVRARYAAAEPGAYDWGAVSAWAWGLSRAVDYLRKEERVDGNRIAVVGHSRLGKASILAAAFDDRIAMAIPLQAGCGGTAPSRGKIGESVKAINEHFPHWFNGLFKQFNDQPERLPFDQHELIALVAPRPVLISCATEDTWSNPEGQFEMARAADPVYRLLGVEGLKAKTMPATGDLVNSRLGYFIRPGKHSMTKVDWEAFWEFARRNLKSIAQETRPVRND